MTDGQKKDYGPSASASEVARPSEDSRVAASGPLWDLVVEGAGPLGLLGLAVVDKPAFAHYRKLADVYGRMRDLACTPESPTATPDTEKCEDCYAYHYDDVLIGHETCDRPNCPGKANPSPPTQPDRPTGTIFELDLFRERMERKAANERLVVEPMTGEEAAAHIGNTLEALAAELKTLIDNCMKQYGNPSPPIPVPIQGEGSWKIVRRPSKVDGYLDRWFVCGDVEIQLDAWMKDEAEPGSHPEKWVMGHGEKDLIELASAAYQAGANSTGEGPYKDGDEMTVKLAGEDYTFPLHGNAVIAANVAAYQAGAKSKDQVVEAAAEVVADANEIGFGLYEVTGKAIRNLATALNNEQESEKENG